MTTEALSLHELTVQIQEAIEVNLPILSWVVGEISDFKENSSGHCYLELIEKDEKTEHVKAKLRATIWARNYRSLKPYFENTTGVALGSGIKILVQCSVNFHPLYGLSLNIIDIEPSYTLGDLEHQRQQTINRLMDDGVIDMNKETVLTMLPKRIAIISSSTAAGYEDFAHQLRNNAFGYSFETKLFSATMQGVKAEESIIMALDQIFEQLPLWDAVAIIRGGGSQVDLSYFDSYNLASNIAQFPIPILTGIGHEKDYTIADIVAHTRLKTPTAVAEFLISQFNMAENILLELKDSFIQSVSNKILIEKNNLHKIQMEATPHLLRRITSEQMALRNLAFNFNSKIERVLANANANISHQEYRLGHLSKQPLLEEKVRLTTLSKIWEKQVKNLIVREAEKINLLERTTLAYDPAVVLKRGFSITRSEGKVVQDLKLLHEGDMLETTLAQGKVYSTVTKPSGKED